MCLSAPFSHWKGGTFVYVLWYMQFFLPLMLLVAIAAKTPKDIVKICGVLAFSCLCHLVLNGKEMYGRYGLSGTFGNPDDVALLAGFTIPFMVLICTRVRNPIVRYTLLSGGCCYLLLMIGRTGTRASIPALVAMLAVYFMRSKGVQRVAILALAILGIGVALIALPTSTIERLSTVLDAFNPQEQHGEMTEAEASAFERHEIMHDAIQATIEHPVVGVGAGMFTQYRWDVMLRPNGQHKPYLPAHNTYLEISSECGFPGVISYLIFLGLIYSQIRAMRKFTIARPAAPTQELMLSITLCTEAALVYFMVCETFMTCDKHPHQFVLAGFAIAMQRMMRAGMTETPVAAQPSRYATVPVPFVGKRSFPIAAR